MIYENGFNNLKIDSNIKMYYWILDNKINGDLFKRYLVETTATDSITLGSNVTVLWSGNDGVAAYRMLYLIHGGHDVKQVIESLGLK